MTRALLALAVVFGISAAFAGDEPPPPGDMTVLTVSGLIGKTNRGPFDPKRDSLLALQKADFKTAFAFDRETLLSLPQGTVTVTTNEFEKPATFSGPLLKEVLGYLEAAQVRTTFVALNGYTGWLDPDDIKVVRLDPGARGGRQAARPRPAGAALDAQYAQAGLQAERRASWPLGLYRVLHQGRRVTA